MVPRAVIRSVHSIPRVRVEVSVEVEGPLFSEQSKGKTAGQILAELPEKISGLIEMIENHLMHSESANGFSFCSALDPLYHHLQCHEMESFLISQLLEDMAASSGRCLLSCLAIRQKKQLKVSQSPRLSNSAPVVWALLVPTVGGKINTIFKLATIFAFLPQICGGSGDGGHFPKDNRCVDQGPRHHHKIFAVVAGAPGELTVVLNFLLTCCLLLLGTMGWSNRGSNILEGMSGSLVKVMGFQIYLVLVYPTCTADLRHIMEKFSLFSQASLIFIKLVEIITCKPLRSQVVRSILPMICLFFEQNVPEGLLVATAENLDERLLSRL